MLKPAGFAKTPPADVTSESVARQGLVTTLRLSKTLAGYYARRLWNGPRMLRRSCSVQRKQHNVGPALGSRADSGVIGVRQGTVVAVGVHAESISRIGLLLERYGNRFLRRVLSGADLEVSERRTSTRRKALQVARSLAGTKAVVKALAEIAAGVDGTAVSVLCEATGSPHLQLNRGLADCLLMQDLAVHISLSRAGDHALALAIVARR